MAVLFDAASTAVFDGVSTINFSHTTSGTNRALTVSVAWYGATVSVSNITYNSVGMTSVGNNTSPWGMGVHMWKLSNPATGTNTVSVTMSAATGSGAIGATSFTGAHQTTASLTDGLDTTAVTAASLSLNVSANASDLVVDAWGINSSASLGTAQTLMVQRDDGFQNILAASYETGAGSTVAMTWGLAASEGAAGVAAALKPAAAAGGTSSATTVSVLSGAITASGITPTIISLWENTTKNLALGVIRTTAGPVTVMVENANTIQLSIGSLRTTSGPVTVFMEKVATISPTAGSLALSGEIPTVDQKIWRILDDQATSWGTASDGGSAWTDLPDDTLT